MEFGLNKKVALVLASSSGIGKATAMEFAREGARVMLCSRSEQRLQKCQTDIHHETGYQPAYTVADITKAGDIKRLVSETVKQLGPVYALINNCGGPPAGGFDGMDDNAWQLAFELTLLSYIRCIRSVVPHMIQSGGGRIVNFTSSSTKQAIDNLILSNTFRMGVVGLTKSLARELAPNGILANVVGPGKLDTERLRSLESIWADKKGVSVASLQKKSVAEIPMGRYGQPREMARLALFLCSTANTYLTGQNILVDGGMVKAY